MEHKRLWIGLVTVVLAAFAVLGFFGHEIYRKAPPIPALVVTTEGRVVADRDAILEGQRVWQSVGGQQVGSIWGHGAYQAPDWSADWLHREALALLDLWSQREFTRPYASLDVERQASLQARLRTELRRNTFDAITGRVTISADRAKAIDVVGAHYLALFGADPSLDELRRHYALHGDAVPDVHQRSQLTAFFFWTAWACATERPGQAVTYTNNWPHEPLIGNVPSGANVVWSAVSVVLLIAGIGAVVALQAFRSGGKEEELPEPPARDPFGSIKVTPSMKATAKYAAVVIALLVVQVLLGAMTAHYTVEGDAFFGLPLGKILPYAVTRTWHVQLGIFWIATAFLTTGLFLAPAVSNHEPKGQRFLVNVLFGALILVVGGSLLGEWLSTHRMLGLDLSWWFGRQGYEYVDLGRAWQIALFGGLVLWLVLMLRGLGPALRRPGELRGLTGLFAAAAAAIGLFYAAGFFYGAKTHLSVMEYWRWWVVHLWVEGFMEVFATCAMAFLFARLGLVRPAAATRASILSTGLFLVTGIPGTFHHLYWSGTPVSIMAVGASFSALEVVPLALVGHEAYQTFRLGERAPWMARYRWPLRFFLGVAFWNLVGAGVFGFLINPPIALYYMQGLNTTPLHGHAALFGVYGLLALGLILVVLRRLTGERPWKEGALQVAFWGMNVGLMLMIVLSLLPIGLMQTSAAVEHGLWWARSAEYLQQPIMQTLRWARIVGDTTFLVGVFALTWFSLGLWFGWSYAPDSSSTPASKDRSEPLEPVVPA